MKKINMKIIDYAVIGMATLGFVGSGYAAYEIMKENKISEKSLCIIEASLGAMALGTIYGVARTSGENDDEEVMFNEESDLEKGVKE